ncbi:MAG: hypothetical protein CFE45_28195 [Burkholderiales bacterium PBB5]|nr:MAG: hypothetical protein CFE45_28195 [Burkholderiales bacterium PBB5]
MPFTPEPSSSHAGPPGVAVAGATGLVGRALVQQLLLRGDGVPVFALVRSGRTPPALPADAQPLVVDYTRLGAAGVDPLPPLTGGFCALGTTIAVAGSREAFRAVDVDAVLAFARAARTAGAQRLAVVSALGADARSAVFYNRCKGEAEDALKAMGFAQLLIARPSLLQGDRSALGQRVRPMEWLAQMSSPFLLPLLPRRWAPIAAATVARALLRASLEAGPGTHVLESDDLQRLGQT